MLVVGNVQGHTGTAVPPRHRNRWDGASRTVAAVLQCWAAGSAARTPAAGVSHQRQASAIRRYSIDPHLLSTTTAPTASRSPAVFRCRDVGRAIHRAASARTSTSALSDDGFPALARPAAADTLLSRTVVSTRFLANLHVPAGVPRAAHRGAYCAPLPCCGLSSWLWSVQPLRGWLPCSRTRPLTGFLPHYQPALPQDACLVFAEVPLVLGLRAHLLSCRD
jgi:hypothetical protein